MPASTRRSAARLVAMVLLVTLAGGCAGQRDDSTAAGQSTTSTTVAPTTTIAPMTAEELAWLKAIPNVRKKIDKRLQTIRNLTTSGMLMLANAYRSLQS